MKPRPFRAPYSVKTYQPRPVTPYRRRVRIHKALAVCGVLCPFIAFAAFGGDIHPGLTLAASLVTFAACVGGVVNLRKLS